jgi:hypothetical protein
VHLSQATCYLLLQLVVAWATLTVRYLSMWRVEYALDVVLMQTPKLPAMNKDNLSPQITGSNILEDCHSV